MVDDPVCRDRLEALLGRIDAGQIEVLDDDELDAALTAHGPRQQLERGGLERRGSAKELVALGRLTGGDIYPGYAWNELRRGGRELRDNGVLCHTAIELQSAIGCPYDCTYCPYTSFVAVRLDIERFVDRAAALARSRPSQTLFKLNNRSDTLGLEPELGLAAMLIERFADLDRQYLMLYSKGNEIDHLLDLDHRRKTVACFTLTPDPVARLLEHGAPPPAARLEAIRRLTAAGYPIRIRLSPIVPLHGWRAMYGELIARLAMVARPEMVTLWTLSMINVENLGRILPLEAVDQGVLHASRRAADRLRGRKGAPFPPEVRVSIYADVSRIVGAELPGTAVSLCLEEDDVWQALGDTLVERQGGRFLCNCAPHACPEAVARQRPASRRVSRG